MSYFSEYYIKMMLQLQCFGFDLKYIESLLQDFNRYCEIYYPKESILTQELSETWIHSSNTHSKVLLNNRVKTMKYLGRYLNSIDIEAYIPKYCIKPDPTVPPTLLDDKMLLLFFKACDCIKSNHKSPNREYIIPVIFRLIYSCGLRSSEACRLRIEDVDLENNILTIYHSKGHKDRLVYMSDSMTELCQNFNDKYCSILPNRNFFFQPSYDKKYYDGYNIRDMFNRILKNCNLYDKYTKKPTPHGLRHLFAVNSMKNCLAKGYDFNNWIKYLSQYMGHASPNETMYYLHMIPQLLPEYSQKISGLTKGLDVIHEES